MSHVAIRIETTHDIAGNPRRGWLVYEIDSDGGSFTVDGRELVAVVAEGYDGDRAMRERWAGAIVLTMLTVTPGQYRAALRQGRELAKKTVKILARGLDTGVKKL